MLLGDSFEFSVQLSSPMLISLTRCSWMIEALGLLQAIKIPQPYVSCQNGIIINDDDDDDNNDDDDYDNF